MVWIEAPAQSESRWEQPLPMPTATASVLYSTLCWVYPQVRGHCIPGHIAAVLHPERAKAAHPELVEGCGTHFLTLSKVKK